MQKAVRHFVPALAGLLLVLALAWYGRSAFKPQRNDDALWAFCSKAVAETGLPEIHYGPGLKHPALWHPPLFVYEIGLLRKLFGSSNFSSRLSGMLGMALTAWLGCAFLVSRGLKQRRPAFLFFLLTGLPFSQGGLVPDIDGALLTPLLMGLFWAQADGLEGRPFPLWKASLLFGALLLSKWTTPPILAALWCAWLLAFRGPSALLKQALPSLALGFLAFLGIYLGWCILAKASPLYAVEFSFIQKAGSAMKSLPWSVKWESLRNGVGVIGAGWLMAAAGAWLSSEKGSAPAFLVAQGLALLLAYSLLFPGLHYHVLTWKYLSPAAAFFALALAMKAEAFEPHWIYPALVLAGVAAYVAGFGGHRHQPQRLDLLYLGLAPCFYLAGRWAGFAWKKSLMHSGLALATVKAAFFMGLIASTPADSSPSFPTGERGFAELVQSEKAAAQGKVLLARKDVLLYLSPDKGIPIDPHFGAPKAGLVVPLEQRPVALAFSKKWPFEVRDWNFYPSFEAAFPDDEAGLRALLLGPVECVADSDYDSFLKSPAMREIMDKRFPVRRRHQHYSFYERKS